MVRGWSRHTCLSLSPHTVDRVWEMMIDPHRGHSWQRRSWPQLLNTETEIQGMSQPGQRQLQLPVQAHKRDPNKTSTPTVTACLYECVFALSHIQLFTIPWTVTHQAPLFMEFSGKNSGVGWHSLLQGIFLTQGSNLGLLHCRQILYHLSH